MLTHDGIQSRCGALASKTRKYSIADVLPLFLLAACVFCTECCAWLLGDETCHIVNEYKYSVLRCTSTTSTILATGTGIFILRPILGRCLSRTNILAQQKLGADLVISIPYDRKSQNKPCCTFCEARLPKPVSQNMQHVLLGSGFEQNLHRADPESYRTKCRWQRHCGGGWNRLLVIACWWWLYFLRTKVLHQHHHGPYPEFRR